MMAWMAGFLVAGAVSTSAQATAQATAVEQAAEQARLAAAEKAAAVELAAAQARLAAAAHAREAAADQERLAQARLAAAAQARWPAAEQARMAAAAQAQWQEKLRLDLRRLGHRNWIVIVDSAYPQQTSPGIETVYVAGDQLEVIRLVLAEVAKTKHVRPEIFTDAELKFVPEKNAPGVTEYRAGLEKVLAGKAAQALPHEQIIGRLDEAGKTFKVLVFKTKLTVPYTSVFLQLDCGYWSAEAERELRDAMRK